MNKNMSASSVRCGRSALFPDELQRHITESLLKESIDSFALSCSEGVLPVTDLTCNQRGQTRPEDICLHVFCAQVLQSCNITFTHELSLHPCFWQKLQVGFWFFLHVLECRFFYNLINCCFTQVFAQESADLGYCCLQVLQGK